MLAAIQTAFYTGYPYQRLALLREGRRNVVWWRTDTWVQDSGTLCIEAYGARISEIPFISLVLEQYSFVWTFAALPLEAPHPHCWSDLSPPEHCTRVGRCAASTPTAASTRLSPTARTANMRWMYLCIPSLVANRGRPRARRGVMVADGIPAAGVGRRVG